MDQEVPGSRPGGGTIISMGYLVSVEVQKPPSRHIVDN